MKNTSLIKLNLQGKRNDQVKKAVFFMVTFPDNEIGDLGAEAFAQLIEKNTSIREITLSCIILSLKGRRERTRNKL